MTPQPPTHTVLGIPLALAYPDPRDTRLCDICAGPGYFPRREGPVPCPRCAGVGMAQKIAAGGVRCDVPHRCGHFYPLELPARSFIRMGKRRVRVASYKCPVRKIKIDGREETMTFLEAEVMHIRSRDCGACLASLLALPVVPDERDEASVTTAEVLSAERWAA